MDKHCPFPMVRYPSTDVRAKLLFCMSSISAANSGEMVRSPPPPGNDGVGDDVGFGVVVVVMFVASGILDD